MSKKSAAKTTGKFLMSVLEVMGEVAEAHAQAQDRIHMNDQWVAILKVELDGLKSNPYPYGTVVRVITDGSDFVFSYMGYGSGMQVQQTRPGGVATYLGGRPYNSDAELIYGGRLHVPGCGLGGQVERIEVRKSNRVLRTHS